ncbi:MAG: hypothetical protein ACK6DP_00385 [Gemmatimonas sp.]|uniref:hypothetical protein n=1 Tax=Gemmatimonas sp. TaxID=1962908 RepID=UPI00391F87A6
MTRVPPYETNDPDDQPEVPATGDEQPLEPWMLAMAREAVDELDAEVVVPREMMWARIQRARSEGHDTSMAHGGTTPMAPRAGRRWSRWLRQVAAVAAVLVGGIAIGRYGMPTRGVAPGVARDTGATATGLGPDALAAMATSTDPVRVAMQEHLVRTVALLTTVRDDDPALGPEADITRAARELLTTTRLLLDQPQLRDDPTRRLLQDLELVLVQVIQARGSAPETQRAPKETLQDTNLLTRVRAIVTASSGGDDLIHGGD